MSTPIRKPTPQRSNGRSFDELAVTNHGNSSRSTRNRRPVESRQRHERRTPVYVRTGTRKPSSNTETAKWSLTKNKAGGKRKKRKTQKKRKSTKKRNNKEKQ